jgi:hypothetical protein
MFRAVISGSNSPECRHTETLTRISIVVNPMTPIEVFQIPIQCLYKSVFEAKLPAPSQLSLSFVRTYGIAQVMTWSVGDMRH